MILFVEGFDYYPAITGVTGALAAGMKVFAYTGGAHTDRAHVAALGAKPFARMRELPALLEAA